MRIRAVHIYKVCVGSAWHVVEGFIIVTPRTSSLLPAHQEAGCQTPERWFRGGSEAACLAPADA